MRTATDIAFDEAQRRIEEADLHGFQEWFFERYAPDDPLDKSAFHADLMALIHRIYAHAQAPLIKQMSAIMSLNLPNHL